MKATLPPLHDNGPITAQHQIEVFESIRVFMTTLYDPQVKKGTAAITSTYFPDGEPALAAVPNIHYTYIR